MHSCINCGKLLKTKQALVIHLKYCQSNKNKPHLISDYLTKEGYRCPHCGKISNKYGIVSHIQQKHEGKNNFINYIKTKGTWNKGLTKQTDSRVLKGAENSKKALSKNNSLTGRKLEKEVKDKISASMKKIVKERPESYRGINTGGKVKVYNVEGQKVRGTWEKKFLEYCLQNDIKCKVNLKGFEYKWENEIHLYFPDFFLVDFGIYVEVKGFESSKDLEKWKFFPHPLVIIREKEISLIDKGCFNLSKVLCDGSRTGCRQAAHNGPE